jgi:hypothetical protein
MSRSMSAERHSAVLGGLPRTRPHRRSDKRATTSAAPATAGPETTPAPELEATPPAAKKAVARKPPAKKTPARKPAAKKPATKKPAARKPAPKKPAAKQAATERAAATTPESNAATRLRQPAQPDGLPAQPRETNRPAPRPPAPPRGGEILGTAVQAAAEIAEIGLSAGARAIRRAVSRLPRP